MGISASSLLDETTSNYIKVQAEAELMEFSPYYKKQFSLARFSEVEDDLEQNKETITQLLIQRGTPEGGEVLYEEGVLFFDDARKWKERYVVVRANYCLECHDGLETFMKGIPPRQKLLPTGGSVPTTEEKYMAMVDKCFPDDTNVKEDFAPPLSGMPGQFPVYLRLPYRRDSYFCFRQEAKRAAFLSILSDCIRHQNQDFLKKKTCEVQAFLKAIQLYRQDKGQYEAWDMLIGSDVRVMANVVMEQLSERAMDQVCQDVLRLADNEELKKALADMAKPNLLNGYQKIGSLQEKLQHLQERFGFSNISGVVHSAQIDLQQLTENAASTFEQLFHKAVQDNPENPGSAIEKAKHRVLKQYDYDSSTVRKRISREALVSVTLPFIKKSLAATCKTELQGLERSVYADHSNYIHIENVYESILLQSLDKEVTKVVKEAASLKKYNLFTDSRDLLSQSSRSSLSSPPVSTPGTPAMVLASPSKTSVEPQPPSPLAVNGLSSSPRKEGQTEESEAPKDAALIETPLGKVEQKDVAQTVAVGEEAGATPLTAEEVFLTVKAEAGPPASADTSNPSETQEVNVEAPPETVIEKEEISVETETVEMAAEPQVQRTDAPKEADVILSETPIVVESTKTDVEEAAARIEAPVPSCDPTDEPANTSAESTDSQTAASCVEETNCGCSEIKLEAPSSGQTAELTSADISLDMKRQEAEPVTVSDPNSMDVSVGSESAPSDVESMEEGKVTQSSEDEVSTTSDVLEDEANVSKSPVSLDDPAGDKTTGDKESPQAQTEAVMSGVEAGASAEPSAANSQPSEPAEDEGPEAQPIGCIKEIRDLVMEVMEVEEPVQRYPSGVPKEEE
ncbi:protein Niban 1a isoform X2 [Anarrhichthys ocellatus]|uniref:protein Niban 1a isoform X2 n=1 Tax=Anarrhichthys ocellatus TaxID=433405 RepID=UPI0012EE2226|nr:protein Niban 1-like isoform X2 [Anarrhichthys ocellatus]